MSRKITGRFQTPVDNQGNRTDIHPITTTDEVIVNPDSEDSEFLTDKLKKIETIVISDTQPDYPCIWAKPV